jgi:hypothetical protein
VVRADRGPDHAPESTPGCPAKKSGSEDIIPVAVLAQSTYEPDRKPTQQQTTGDRARQKSRVPGGTLFEHLDIHHIHRRANEPGPRRNNLRHTPDKRRGIGGRDP